MIPYVIERYIFVPSLTFKNVKQGIVNIEAEHNSV